MTAVSDGKAALNALYWRGEILQAMYWMRGEGLAPDIDARRLAEFLAVDTAQIEEQMCALASEGFVRELALDSPRYELTPLGIAEGGRSFQDEFAELTHAAHYECAPGCWCHDPDHIGEPCPSTPPPPKRPAEPPSDPPEPESQGGGRHGT